MKSYTVTVEFSFQIQAETRQEAMEKVSNEDVIAQLNGTGGHWDADTWDVDEDDKEPEEKTEPEIWICAACGLEQYLVDGLYRCRACGWIS